MRRGSVWIVLVIVLLSAAGLASAQTSDQTYWAHVQVRDLEVLTVDRQVLTVDAFAVVEADPPDGLTDADLTVLRGDLQAAVRSAFAETLSSDDVDPVWQRMGPPLSRAAEARGLRLLTHGIATIRPSPEMAARIASRLEAEAERARRAAEAAVQSIEAEAAARAARIEAEAATARARIGAQVDAEAARILAAAAAVDPDLYAFWSSRLVVDGWAGATATHDPFGTVDALMAACLAPLAARHGDPADPTKARPPSRVAQPKQAAVGDTASRITVTVPALTRDAALVDALVAVELLRQDEAAGATAGDDAALLADLVSAAATRALRQVSLEQAMDRRPALPDALRQAVDDMVGAAGRQIRIDGLTLQDVALDERLAAAVLDPDWVAALTDQARAAAEATVDLAEADARAVRLAAEAEADRTIRQAEADAAHFGMFLDRYRADPVLTAHLFCRDLVEGWLRGD